jgi:hypothetical protein
MATVESFSTAGLDPRRKLTYWNERACESFSPLVSDPADIRTFNGSIARASIGDLSIAEVYSDAQIVRHSRAHVARTRSSLFFLHLQMEGESVNRQDGREALLRAGDFTLCDSTRHYEIAFGGPNRMLVLGIPDAILRRHIACPECLVAIPMASASGVCSLLSRFLRNFWVEYQRSRWTCRPRRASTRPSSTWWPRPTPICHSRDRIVPRSPPRTASASSTSSKRT